MSERSGFVRAGRRRAALALLALIAAPLSLALVARADWLQPDPSYREAQQAVRQAQRDTLGHGEDVARLDSLAVALLRLGRAEEATKLFRRTLALAPADGAALAGLGKLALHADRAAEAESLLALADTTDGDVLGDLYCARLRRGEWLAAAATAPGINAGGRVELLERMAETPPLALTAGPDQITLLWSSAYPTPLVRVKVEGQSVLMALDTGASGVLIDKSAARRLGVSPVGGDFTTLWLGGMNVVSGAMLKRVEISGMRLENVPAGIIDLKNWSLMVNPQGERVAGVLGLSVLRRFTPTLDYDKNRLILRRPGVAWTPGPKAQRVPFEVWGEDEIMVSGTIGSGRRMAFIVQTGLPACGIAAPSEVFDEVGLKPGGVAKLMKSMGSMLSGRPWTEVTAPAVSVGPVLKNKVPGWSGAMDSGELWRHGIRRDAIVSGGFFKDRVITFDWARREIVFEKPD